MIIAGKYDADTLVKVILKAYPDIRDGKEYKEEMDRIIDETMSCDKGEQRAWMMQYMKEAIHMDTHAKLLRGDVDIDEFRRRAATQYIVAYDLL